MRRVSTLSSHVVASVPSAAEAKAPALKQDDLAKLMQIMQDYRESKERLLATGEPPAMSLWDLLIAVKHEMGITPKDVINSMLDKAEAAGLEDLKILHAFPGPWRDTKTRDEQFRLIRKLEKSFHFGNEQQLIAQWQLECSDKGLGGNIAIPKLLFSGDPMNPELRVRIIIADAADAERLARNHVRKEHTFFQDVIYDSVLSTTDNEDWKNQRRHLAEVFLPLSSLAQIMPVSLARAKHCAERLGVAAKDGEAVDMSDFLLHEAQAQLQLALLGASEDLMEATNQDIRDTFMGDSENGEPGRLGKAMKQLMELAQTDTSLALPTDERPVKGPLSRAVGSGGLPGMTGSSNYGNMLLILFAGHDTTGHTMTWLMMELGRNPEIQRTLQHVADNFFEMLSGRDPTYQDLGSSILDPLDRCVTETLRLWPAVANGTYRQLQFGDSVTGADGQPVDLPRGTSLNIVNWSRHRNPDLWGADANEFNPYREFFPEEIAHVARPLAAVSPQSERFSPFAHAPRHCLGRNFAQMEMRLILLNLLQRFDFTLAPPYDKLRSMEFSATPAVGEFRGVNRGTMGPMDLERTTKHSWGTRYQYAMKMNVTPRKLGV